MQKYNILELNEKLLPELQSIAEELGIKKVSSLKKEELVYRILDEQAISYAGIQAEKEKEKEAKKKQQIVKVKEVQLSCRIDTHDFETRVNHARRFLEGGDKVKVMVGGAPVTQMWADKIGADAFTADAAEAAQWAKAYAASKGA